MACNAAESAEETENQFQGGVSLQQQHYQKNKSCSIHL